MHPAKKHAKRSDAPAIYTTPRIKNATPIPYARKDSWSISLTSVVKLCYLRSVMRISKSFARGKTNHYPKHRAHHNLVQQHLVYPASAMPRGSHSPFTDCQTKGRTGILHSYQVDRHHQIGQSQPVVCPRLAQNKAANVERDEGFGEATCISRVKRDLPLQMELARTGSVGVTHAETTRDSRNVKPGTIPHMSKPVTSQPHVMTGRRSTKSDSHCFLIYCLGRLTPVNKTCRPMMMRASCMVKSRNVSRSSLNQAKGFKMLATSGPKMIPVIHDGTASAEISSEAGLRTDVEDFFKVE